MPVTASYKYVNVLYTAIRHIRKKKCCITMALFYTRFGYIIVYVGN